MPGPLGWWIAVLSVVMFVGSLLLIPLVVVRLPADYFVREQPATNARNRHPAVWLTLLVVKNGIGGLLLLAGMVMLFVPGQGILAILVGLSLIDLPGKRALERRIVGHPPLLRAINRLRARAGRPPIRLE